jgi:hypothetical protein
MMSLRTFVDVSLGQILHAACSQERDDVPLDTPGIRNDGRRFLGPPTFPQDEPCVEVIEVERTELLDRDRLVIELALLCGIVALSNAAQLDLRFLPRTFGGPHTMQADRIAARATQCSVLEDVAALARSEDAQAETW